MQVQDLDYEGSVKAAHNVLCQVASALGFSAQVGDITYRDDGTVATLPSYPFDMLTQVEVLGVTAGDQRAPVPAHAAFLIPEEQRSPALQVALDRVTAGADPRQVFNLPLPDDERARTFSPAITPPPPTGTVAATLPATGACTSAATLPASDNAAPTKRTFKLRKPVAPATPAGPASAATTSSTASANAAALTSQGARPLDFSSAHRPRGGVACCASPARTYAGSVADAILAASRRCNEGVATALAAADDGDAMDADF